MKYLKLTCFTNPSVCITSVYFCSDQQLFPLPILPCLEEMSLAVNL